MREYKFRAPHPDTGKLYYFQFYPTWGSDLPGPPAWHGAWADTVEQYTGLKDKNGREIYEGDIINAPDSYGPGRHNYEVTWETLDSEEGHVGYGYRWYDFYDDAEVIGNIHENADLLK